jgi:hypothetical protein
MIARSQWSADNLVDILQVASYVNLPPMIKDIMSRLCQEIPYKSPDEFEVLTKRIEPLGYFTPLAYCMPFEKLTMEHQKVVKEFHQLCLSNLKLGRDYYGPNPSFMLGYVRMIEDAIPECLNNMNRNHLHLVLSSDIMINYRNFEEFKQSESLLKGMGLKFKFGYLCYRIRTYPEALLMNEAELLFVTLKESEYRNALLHCIQKNAPDSWPFREEALKKADDFRKKCKLEPDFKMGSSITNADCECLSYIKENRLYLVTYSTFSLVYNDLQAFDASADLLKGIGVNIELKLSKWDGDMALLAQSLNRVPNLTALRIDSPEQMLDLSLFPDVSQLRELEINYAQLSRVPEFLLKEFLVLGILNLSNNRLTEFGEIKSAHHLRWLYLYENRLTDVSDLMKSHLLNLLRIDLDDNRIMSMGEFDKHLMPNLWSIHCRNQEQQGGNRGHCDFVND